MRALPPLAAVSAMLFLSTAVPALDAQCLSGWGYRVPIVIDNSSGEEALSDYQLSVTVNTAAPVSAAKMKPDGSDIRFTGEDCRSALSYWIEGGMNSSSTKIWVRIPSIPAGASTTIYLHYGNPSAASASDGNGTFLLFDDFDGTALDADKWTQAGDGSRAISGGAITFWSASGSSIVRSRAVFPFPVVTEMNVKAATGYWPSLAQLRASSEGGYTMFMGGGMMNLGATFDHDGAYAGFLEMSAPLGAPAGIWSLAWGPTGTQTATWPGGSMLMSDSDDDTGPVNVALGNLQSGSSITTVDWVRVRRHAMQDPVVSIGAEARIYPLSISSHPADAAVCAGQPASFSVSANGTALTYQWKRNGVPIPGATGATYDIPVTAASDAGVYSVLVSGQECCSGIESNSAALVVRPAPSLTLSLSRTLLWPANNHMYDITASVNTSGYCTPLSVVLLSVTSNEELVASDVTMADVGTEDYQFRLRARRSGNGNGRVYTVTYRVTDAAGNTASASGTVSVPHHHGLGKLSPEAGDRELGGSSGHAAAADPLPRPIPSIR